MAVRAVGTNCGIIFGTIDRRASAKADSERTGKYYESLFHSRSTPSRRTGDRSRRMYTCMHACHIQLERDEHEQGRTDCCTVQKAKHVPAAFRRHTLVRVSAHAADPRGCKCPVDLLICIVPPRLRLPSRCA